MKEIINNIKNKEAPHQAIINFRIDVYERDETGRCIPPLSRLVNKNYTLIGKDFDDLNKQIEKFTEVFQNAKSEYEQSQSIN